MILSFNINYSFIFIFVLVLTYILHITNEEKRKKIGKTS